MRYNKSQLYFLIKVLKLCNNSVSHHLIDLLDDHVTLICVKHRLMVKVCMVYEWPRRKVGSMASPFLAFLNNLNQTFYYTLSFSFS